MFVRYVEIQRSDNARSIYLKMLITRIICITFALVVLGTVCYFKIKNECTNGMQLWTFLDSVYSLLFVVIMIYLHMRKRYFLKLLIFIVMTFIINFGIGASILAKDTSCLKLELLIVLATCFAVKIFVLIIFIVLLTAECIFNLEDNSPDQTMLMYPVIRFTKNEFGNTNINKECPVCLNDFAEQEKVKILPCNHIYHEPCIDPWVIDHDTCPHCRASIRVTV